MPMREAASVCKAILRNGYDAYVVNADLQMKLFEITGEKEIDISCEPDFGVLNKIFPNLERGVEDTVIGRLCSDETGFLYRFYSTEVSDAAHPDVALNRLTPRILRVLHNKAPELSEAVRREPEFIRSGKVIDCASGYVRLAGIPQLTLRRNYALAIRVLRLSANYDLPVEASTWVAIVDASAMIADYVPYAEFIAEWRQVAAESMWRFAKLLADSHILHGMLPEVDALMALKQNAGKLVSDEQSVFEHTIDCMRYYPEEKLHYDWIGVVACFLMNVGKLYTAEKFENRWTFYQHHRVGAKIARTILRRLHFDPQETELICSLIRNQMRFQSMLTDRGLRRFMELPEKERLIEIARANIRAQKDGTYTNFNHNLKYLKRAETPEEMLEPLLNGNQIMEYTGLPQGPEVGIIREALLKAQIAGVVNSENLAVAFVRNYLTRMAEKNSQH